MNFGIMNRLNANNNTQRNNVEKTAWGRKEEDGGEGHTRFRNLKG